jgi:trehalose 6-phosphate synthase/phosphatase
LKGDLHNLTANLDLNILEGDKVIEVRDAGVNKGSAAARLARRFGPEFTLAVGDDHTDEDVFSTLLDSAYTIKVGLGPSQAKFNLDSVAGVRSLLKKLAR